MTEWGCMQALIDFEGWRKWRGFMDSPRAASPTVDTSSSPMQGGYHKDPPLLDPPSPSILRPANRFNHEAKPTLPDAAQIMREDSWGSGSLDSIDSTSGDGAPGSDATIVPDEV